MQALDDTGTQTMRLGYSPFGQLMPYQYTGGYTDGNTGFVHLDARWYNPHASRFVQPDYWNLKNTYLPTEIQHELMRFTGLSANQLLRDPDQQLAFGYVSGNPLSWVDPFGLFAPLAGAAAGAVLDATIQLGEIAFSEDKTLSDFDWAQVGINAAAGAVGAGIGTKITNLATKVGNAMATPTKAAAAAKVTDLTGNTISGGAIGAIAGTVSDKRSGNPITPESIAEHALAGAIAGGGSVFGGRSGVLDEFGEYSANPKPPRDVLSGALVGEVAIANSNGVIEKVYEAANCP